MVTKFGQVPYKTPMIMVGLRTEICKHLPFKYFSIITDCTKIFTAQIM